MHTKNETIIRNFVEVVESVITKPSVHVQIKINLAFVENIRGKGT